MIKYEKNPRTGAISIISEPPAANLRAYNTRICVVPNTCHGCGNCKLCGPGCTCYDPPKI